MVVVYPLNILPIGDNAMKAYTSGTSKDGKVTWAYKLVDGTTTVGEDCGTVTEPRALESENIAGQLTAIMRAIRRATELGAIAVEVVTPLQGAKEWSSGAWKTKTWVTQQYAKFISKVEISLDFAGAAASDAEVEEATRPKAKQLLLDLAMPAAPKLTYIELADGFVEHLEIYGIKSSVKDQTIDHVEIPLLVNPGVGQVCGVCYISNTIPPKLTVQSDISCNAGSMDDRHITLIKELWGAFLGGLKFPDLKIGSR